MIIDPASCDPDVIAEGIRDRLQVLASLAGPGSPHDLRSRAALVLLRLAEDVGRTAITAGNRIVSEVEDAIRAN